MQTIDRQQLQDMLNSTPKPTLVEVLPKEEFRDYHLPGAMNIPTGEGFKDDIQKAVKDKSEPVVVYCKNTDCGASPKAAKDMDELGYEKVYDYEGGKEDWKQAGLEVEQ